MTEYISRKAVLNEIDEWIDVYSVSTEKDYRIPLKRARASIAKTPTADVEPVRHGRWTKKRRHRGGIRRYTGIDDMGEQHTITVDEQAEYDDLYCSECGKQSADNFLNYCPNCGAKMDGDANNA